MFHILPSTRSIRPVMTITDGNNTNNSINDNGNNNDEQVPILVLKQGVFQHLEQAQSNHGIPHQDYAQYHQYCTQRLARLRRIREVRTKLVHNAKFVEGVSGRRNAYCPRKLFLEGTTATGSVSGDEVDGPPPLKEPVLQHENLLWNVLFQAERAWAHGCLLTAEQQQQPRKSKHGHIQRRLNKAAHWADTVVEMARALNCHPTTIREAQSYAAWMNGNAALERKDHLRAFRAYREARQVLLQLVLEVSERHEDSRETLALRDTWMGRAESVLKPLLRYCQYEAHDQLEESDLLPEIEHGVAIKGSKVSSSDILIIFRGKEIALDHYKDLAVVYLKVQDILSNPLKDLDESRFLQLLSDLDDAIKIVHSEMSRYESLPVGPSVTAKREELQTLADFFQYHKLCIWREQQEKMVEGLSDDAAILHIYDTLLQNAQAMAELPRGDDGILEEDQLWLEAQAHVIRIRAFRCYYMARLYESSSELGGTPQQVLGLLQHSMQLAKRAQEEVAASDLNGSDSYLKGLSELVVKIEYLSCRVEATLLLQSQQSIALAPSARQTNRPLWLRLDDYDAGPVLVDDPPVPIPIPCKPAFYDIAWQHVGSSFPVGALEEYIAKQQKQTKKSAGFFGWFSS